jgi:hypothetical protein
MGGMLSRPISPDSYALSERDSESMAPRMMDLDPISSTKRLFQKPVSPEYRGEGRLQEQLLRSRFSLPLAA